MPTALPKWLTHRYALLWKAKTDGEFEYEAAREILKEKDDKTLSVILSELRKYGWLRVRLHPENARKRIYQLERPNEVLEKIAENIKKQKDRRK